MKKNYFSAKKSAFERKSPQNRRNTAARNTAPDAGGSRTAAEISELKLRSQWKLVQNALHAVLCAVFREGKPADRVLSGYFRENRRCGSRDRQLISEAVFCVLRFWGILRQMLPQERREALENGSEAPSARELEMLLKGVFYLEDLAQPWMRKWLQIPEVAPDFAQRCRILFRAFQLDAPDLAPGKMLPEWISCHLAMDFPLKEYVESMRQRPPMWLRLQSQDRGNVLTHLADAGLFFRNLKSMPDAVAVEGAKVNLFTLDAYREGWFEVQDLASQIIGAVAAPRPGERWLDCCAGAGGKSLQLASLMARRGTVVASDVRAYKLEDLRKRARRAGFPNIQTKAWDGKNLRPQQREKFDGVLVDAPCSCSGVWRRNPDGCWSLKPEDVAETAKIQRSVLSAVADGVRPGGVLIYATCSIFPEENQNAVADFLAQRPDFVPEAFAHPLTGETVQDGMLQVLPGVEDCDSMFVARLRRRKE